MRNLQIKSLPPKGHWVDRDEIMFHACFQILEDCIEKEKVDKHCDYKAHKFFVDEARTLYRWWKKRKRENFELNYEKDQSMLLRLINIRQYLWT